MNPKQMIGMMLAILMVSSIFIPVAQAAGENTGIDLSATIKDPRPEIGIAVDTESIDFGELLPGETSASHGVTATNIGLKTIDVTMTVEDDGAEAIFVPGITVNGDDWNDYFSILLSDGGDTFDVALNIPETVTSRGAVSGTLTVWAEEKLNIYSTAQENVNPGAPDAGVPGFVGPDGIGKATDNNHVNPIFAAWASYVADYSPSPQSINPMFSNPTKALGPVTGDNFHIVSLGDLTKEQIDAGIAPGSLTLGFDVVIVDGPGPDFAAFENGFISAGGAGVAGQIFAELGYVEVSTDGVTFVRFPSVSLASGDVGGYGTVDPTTVYNLVGKHVNAYGDSWGTPFDLSDLADTPEVLSGAVHLDNINYVRIVDIPGSGDFVDSLGNPIYDAWVTTGSGGVDFEALGVINASPRPFAKFSADIIGGVAPLTVQFTDLSTNLPTAWEWDFGDGTIGTEQNPEHIYTTPGVYTVTLTASNAFGSGTLTKTDIIAATLVAVVPTAAFSADIIGGVAPLTVQFTDSSLNQPTSWLWSFGDGTTSTERNPSHEYTVAGVYTVSLTVTNTAGSDEEVKVNMIAVIDPIPDEALLSSTYLGGSGDDTISDANTAVAVGPDGSIYVIGSTPSTDLPVTSGAYQSSNGGSSDGFIARYSSDMSALLALTYFGGSGNDRASGIAVAGDGSVYVVGWSQSSGLATDGAHQATLGGGTDAFVAKFDASLSSLAAFTYLGGTGAENGRGIIIGSDGGVYITGNSASDGLATDGAYQTTRGGGVDAFVAKFDASLNTLLACTYLGGSGVDQGNDVAIGEDGSVYLVGYAGSIGLATEGAFDTTLDASSLSLTFDAILAKFDASLNTLLACTYLGGGWSETKCSIEVLDDRVLIAVQTGSEDMPTTPGAFGETQLGGKDAYIACFDPMLSTLLYGSYFGGTGSEDLGGIAIASDGTLIMVGQTASTDLPTKNAVDDSHNGGNDLFLTRWALG